ncbi:MAG: DUF2460 domain-containing protein [Candidatus Gastranaerophilaceae bacterium]
MTIPVFNFPCKRAYQMSSKWNTIIDQMFSGKEQRRNQWTDAQKTWNLSFDKTPENTTAVLAFFDARKGKFEAFNWVWPTDMGGDGQTYLVRFDTDELNMDMFNGFSEFQLKLVQVFSA